MASEWTAGQRWGTKCSHKAQGGLDQGQTQGQGGAEGPSWKTSRQAWAAGPGLEWGEWALRTQNGRGCDPIRGPLSGRGDISSLPDGIPLCWARGPWVTVSAHPAWDLASPSIWDPLLVCMERPWHGRPCGSGGPPGQSEGLRLCVIWGILRSLTHPQQEETLAPPAVQVPVSSGSAVQMGVSSSLLNL